MKHVQRNWDNEVDVVAAGRCNKELTVHVAVCRLTLHINSSHSLKEKRRVVQSVRQRLSNRFGVAVAEVDSQDAWQLATLGLAAVGESRAVVRSLMEKAVEHVYVAAPEAVVTDADIDVFSY